MTKDASPVPEENPAEKTIAFQGEPGANSHIACREAFPDMTGLACATFEDAILAVQEGRAAAAMLPIENSLAGRIGDIHHLLPESGLYIVGEHFLRIRFHLLGVKGATVEGLKTVQSQPPALGQCRKIIRELGLTMIAGADTAGSAREVAEKGDTTRAAIATTLAADIYGLDILRPDIEDETHNTTRFLIMAKEPEDAEPEDEPVVTSFIFRVRNVPAALYKALGGFATNGVNMTKLESYQLEGTFNASQFYADIDGHPASRNVRLALEELEFFTSELRILGIYKAHPYRATLSAN
ncbi:MAG: prephenate dehydratase [Alphaproteobacteria bacterium HGW-Alphaproteobacteria-12]|nr:MAG: prephenate dehydratase [Alphaproteobacteria bacterium HGW-Alphaproteobacteria-12]